MNITEDGSPDQLRARALRMLDAAGLRRRMAARLMSGAQRTEHEAIRLAHRANQREAGQLATAGPRGVDAVGPNRKTADETTNRPENQR